jgi:hypothetical protein
MQKKMMWVIFFVISTAADIMLPLIWGILLTLPLFILSWWIAYKSGWFD